MGPFSFAGKCRVTVITLLGRDQGSGIREQKTESREQRAENREQVSDAR
jgi:hypothetical protein